MVRDVLGDCPSKMPLAERNQPIEALLIDRSHETLGVGIRIWARDTALAPASPTSRPAKIIVVRVPRGTPRAMRDLFRPGCSPTTAASTRENLILSHDTIEHRYPSSLTSTESRWTTSVAAPPRDKSWRNSARRLQGWRSCGPPPLRTLRTNKSKACSRLRDQRPLSEPNFGARRNCSQRQAFTRHVNFLGILEAPPGFEPGMEVLQIPLRSLSC